MGSALRLQILPAKPTRRLTQEHVKVASQSLQPSERLPSVAAALSMAANSTGEPLALATVSGNWAQQPA